jgi:hypothetical protein
MKEKTMRHKTLGTSLAAGVLVTAGLLGIAGRVGAQDQGNDDQSKIKKGFEIAPVPLNLKGKNRSLVGLGSYVVNATGGCNDCHTNPSYAPGHDPYAGEPKQFNSAVYLAGGTIFGDPAAVHFTSRNLTPGKTGLPAGDLTYDEFVTLMRTGVDHDHWHPQFGPFLQVMPWPVYQDLTDRDLRAIYEYLSSIPCVEGDPGNPNGTDTGYSRCGN